MTDNLFCPNLIIFKEAGTNSGNISLISEYTADLS
ncbi:hypothetical protein NIES2107_36400 [Nostoc carneum NIES-2107]|nr:hypothetical protein NIES2107_36400 [Nostoc carneum NIES-2107]